MNLRKDVRKQRARELFAYGIGHECGFRAFPQYLASIPVISPWMLAKSDYFDRLLLIDNRLPLKRLAYRAKILIPPFDIVFQMPAPLQPPCDAYWILCQNGLRTRGQDAASFCAALPANEATLHPIEGIYLYLEDLRVRRAMIEEDFFLDFPQSTILLDREQLTMMPCFGMWAPRIPLLYWWDKTQRNERSDRCGIASRRISPENDT